MGFPQCRGTLRLHIGLARGLSATRRAGWPAAQQLPSGYTILQADTTARFPLAATLTGETWSISLPCLLPMSFAVLLTTNARLSYRLLVHVPWLVGRQRGGLVYDCARRPQSCADLTEHAYPSEKPLTCLLRCCAARLSVTPPMCLQMACPDDGR